MTGAKFEPSNRKNLLALMCVSLSRTQMLGGLVSAVAKICWRSVPPFVQGIPQSIAAPALRYSSTNSVYLCVKAWALVVLAFLATRLPLAADVTEPVPAAVIPSSGFDLFGAATATNVDTLLVGAPFTEGARGAVHLFYREGTDYSAWRKHQVLRPTYLGKTLLFGNALSYDQNAVAIGTFHGPVFVFERLAFSDDYQQAAVIELAMDDIATFRPGSLSLNEGVLAIGQNSSGAAGKDEAGSVLIYARTPAGWQHSALLQAADPRESAMFGSSVQLLGTLLVVGAPGDEHVPGAVYIFERVAGKWEQRQKITAPTDEAASYFGQSLTTNGGQLVVGAPGDGVQSTGHVYLFERIAPDFSEFVFAKEFTPAEPLAPAAQFGLGVAMDGNNRNIIVTRLAPASTADTQEPGAAYVFTLGLRGWTHRLTMAPTEFPSSFGISVAAGSTHAVIGDYGASDKPGTAYVYDLTLPETPPVFLEAPKDQTIDAPPGQAATATFGATMGDENGRDFYVYWTVDGVQVQQDFVDGGLPPTPASLALTTTLTPGAHTIRILAEKAVTGLRAEHSFTVNVGDSAGPTIVSVTARPSIVTSQHGRFVLARLNVVAVDPSGPTRWKITSVESSDPTAPRKGQLPDWMILSARKHSLLVRAATSDPKKDRVYTVHVEVSDAAGNKTEGETTVTVVATANRRARR